MTDQADRHGQVPLLSDEVYRRALEVGRTSAGVSGPNPPVGCLIVRDGAVIAEGATEVAGGRHAEVVALAAAGERARGSIAVVTLEPCAHQGRTPPCTAALLAAGVAGVHVLLRDPDPVAAGGIAALDRAGLPALDVGQVRPELAASAMHDLRGFLARVAHGRPHVTLKLAQSVDGGTVPGVDRYLTGVVARRHVHALRAESDAVLVGGATVRTDDPLLDVRHVRAHRQPRPVLLSASGEFPAHSSAVRRGAIVVHGPTASAVDLDRLRAAGVRLIRVPIDPCTGGLDVRAALSALLEERILTVLAEPGERLAGALLDAHVVDTVELHVAGGAEATVIRPALPALTWLLRDVSEVERTVTSDGDLLLRARCPRIEPDDVSLAGAA